MPVQAFQQLEAKLERRIRLFEEKYGHRIERPIRRFEQKVEQSIEKRIRFLERKFELIEQKFERNVERPIRLIEHKVGRNIQRRIRRFEQKNGIRLDDEMRFIRSWIEKPLAIGAVTPSSRALARTMARFVDPDGTGPVVELGPGTGPITEALVDQGVEPSRLVLVEFNPVFCQLLRARYPEATVIQGDAYRLRGTLAAAVHEPIAAVVSGLPLVTKPMRTRVRLLREAFAMMRPGAPFVQFTYAVTPPIPKLLADGRVEASERIWLNLPPARVWIYRKPDGAEDRRIGALTGGKRWSALGTA